MDPISLIAILAIVVTLAVGAYKRFDLVPVLVIGNLVIYFLEIFFVGVQTDLSFRPMYLTSGDNIYTVFTQMFVHDRTNFLHVLFNMLFLYLIGSPLESRIGKWRLAVIYFAAGIIGVLIEAIVITGSPGAYILGASGAISGVMGAMLILYPRDEIPMFLGPIFLPRVPVWISVGSWFGLQVLLVFGDPVGPVAYAAHVSGFVAGMALGWVLASNIKEKAKIEAKPMDFSQLEPLATTPELRNALETIKNETQRDVRKAWLEYFAEHAKCPKCGGKMKYKGSKIKCTACEFEIELR